MRAFWFVMFQLLPGLLMSLSVYLWGVRLITLLSFSAWIGIVVAVDPQKAGTIGMILFFSSLFASMLGVFTLLLTSVYRRALGEVSALHHLGSAFRQAFLLALFSIGIVFFQKERILTWWDSALLFAAILLIEYSFRKIVSETKD